MHTSNYLRQSVNIRQVKSKWDANFLYFAKDAVFNLLPNVLVTGKVSGPNSLHEEQFLLLREIQKLLGLLLVHAKRFFAKDMLPIVEHEHSYFVMLRIESSNVDDFYENKVLTFQADFTALRQNSYESKKYWNERSYLLLDPLPAHRMTRTP